MSVGRASESFAPIGSNLPGYDNYFCRDCWSYVHAPKGASWTARVPDAAVHERDGIWRVVKDAEASS